MTSGGKAARCWRPGRGALAWAVAWGVLTAAGSALHWGAWIAAAQDPPVATALGTGVFRQIGNVMAIGAAPGWIAVIKGAVTMLGLNSWVTGHSMVGTVLANGVGFGVVLVVLALVLRAARWVKEGGRARGKVVAAASAAGGAVDLGRRRLIVNTALAGMGAGCAGSVAYGSVVEPWDLRLARHRVKVRGLPARLEGMRIMQVSDTHLGPRVPAEHIERAMRLALESCPDVVALTGDYVHNGLYQIAPAVELFSRFMYDYIPVVAVLGNHDWYAGGRAMREALSRIGVRMIDNDRVFFDAEGRRVVEEPIEGGLCLAGVGDLQMDRVDFGAALRGVPEEMPRIVLSHNPDAAESADLVRGGPGGVARRVDLMLSGHTHGGQVRLPIIGPPVVPSAFGAKYAHGVNAGPACRVLTSAGVGLSLVPLRIGVPPEVVEITLERA